ncbi:MAG: SatD family protein [Bacteroidota bacterium]
MIAVITGDIINSRKVDDASIWLNELKNVFNLYGSKPADWEIYRGDSFQIKTTPGQALKLAFHIKATIKQFKPLDVRMGIGIGEVSFVSDKITESNGEAFINSGESFDSLDKITTVQIKAPWNKEFNTLFSLTLSLAMINIDNWTPASSEVVKASIENPDLKQGELAELLSKKQSDISKGLKRADFSIVNDLINHFPEIVKQELC